jgi:predicted aspartyl protease
VRAGTIAIEDLRETRTYRQADGTSKRHVTFRIRSLRIGGVTLQNVIGSVGEDAAFPLLGQTFLSRFKSWSIDNPRQVLVLE